ncbi:MAG: phosphoribosylaminoimidazolesuccinocarboxamide synthase [Gammaproteobacteria bacterium]
MTETPIALQESSLESLPLFHRGKVRDSYAVGDDHLLIVATDRLSAFDVILPTPVPSKGRILTDISNFWFERTSHIVPNHLTDIQLEDVLSDPHELAQVRGRAVVVHRLTPLPAEAVIRGYLIGSGWKDYQRSGSVCGIELPENLRLAQKLPQPIFTPATKAAVGDHDENISYDELVKLIGEEHASQVKQLSHDIYLFAADYAAHKGIIIADTKFEFGLDANNNIVLMDEVLTPDSSRFWPQSCYAEGISPPSYDKQFVRDYLETLDWNKTSPGPSIPDNVLKKTADKYREARDLLLA